MTVSVRFAPSPTGRLHIGNIRTAILNWLFAHKAGGQFILRFDDTDTERSREEFVEAIRTDLNWLGLKWDREERQTSRTKRYDEVVARLKESGQLYACYETSDDLDRKRKRQLARGMPPIYDRTGLKLSPEERRALEVEGRKPHWRLVLPNTETSHGAGYQPGGDLAPMPTIVSWNDLVRGDQTVDLGSLSDPVLIREDGSYLYTLTSVIDDADMGITHIIRGEDHVTNTGVQLALFDAIGAEPPIFGHHNLLIAADGQALSKRLGALSIESMREGGLEPLAVCAHAALIGTSDPVEPHASLGALAELFSPDKLSSAPARFDMGELTGLNAKFLHGMAYDGVAKRLADAGISGGEDFWLAVRGNLEKFDDAKVWWDVVAGSIAPVVEDTAFLAKAAELLPVEPWDGATWSSWTNALKAETGAKGRALFHPLRLALTGREKGPELKDLLPLIGRERALARLQGQTA